MNNEIRLKEIINNNPPPDLRPGMLGGMMVFSDLLNPSLAKLKRLAAESLLSHIGCVEANRRMFGREYKGTMWLDRSAHFRNLATKKLLGV